MMGYRHKMLAIYLLYGPLFFPSDAADSVDTVATPRSPGYLSVRSRLRIHVKTRDHLGQ